MVRTTLCQRLGISFPNRTDCLSGYHIFPAHSWYLSFQKRLINTALWCILMLTVGYTTYAVILIRANANTPLNENAPDNIFALKAI